MTKIITVVTNPELGWDCVVGVYDHNTSEEAIHAEHGEDVVLHPQMVSTISNDKPSEVNIKDLILEEYKNGNIVVSTFDGLKTASLKDIVNQPIDGLLYDINRNESTILTLIDDPKWINDYAASKVIQELKRQLEELKSK